MLDLREPGFWTEPVPLLRAARARGRTALTQLGEPVLLRADDAEQAHADPRLANPGVANLERLGIRDGPFFTWRRRTLAALEGAEHQRLRGFIGRLFTPRQTARVRDQLHVHAAGLLDGLAERGTVDLVSAYAGELPLWGICRFLGIPDEERLEIAGFLAGTEEGFTEAMTPEIRARAERSIVALHAHAERRIAELTRMPGPDALSALVSGWRESGVSNADFVALVVNIIGGAVGSTRSAISNVVLLLLQHPDQAHRVRARPELLRAAVEECLRLYPPFRIGRRVAVEPLHLAGLDLEPGQSVLVWRAAANRDPGRFERPDVFDVERAPRAHLSFGHGTHFCLGQALARIEVQEAVGALLVRHPDAALRGPPPRRVPFTMDEQLVALPVELGPARRI